MTGNFGYDVFVNEPPPQDGFLPNGEPKRFSPMASTLIYGSEDAVLTDPGMTEDQAAALGDWVAARDRNLTDIFITHGHGDHWFAAGLRRRAAADREHRRRLLQRQDRAVPGLPGAADPVGDRPSSLRCPRARR